MDCKKRHQHFSGTVESYSHFSESTQTEMSFAVFRPAKESVTQVTTLFWLSGLTCTHENFITKAGACRWADELGIMLICPDTSPRGTNLPAEHESYDFGSGAGFYLNAQTQAYKKHYRMEEYLTGELVSLVHKHFNMDSNRLGIFGHSMGGHGALTLGLKNPKLFRSISAFAPICAPMQCPWGVKALTGYLGNDRNLWKSYDASELLKITQFDRTILIDQGDKDEFLQEQLKPEKLIEVAKQMNFPLEVRMQVGFDHSYYFISTFIKDHLEFHNRQLSEN